MSDETKDKSIKESEKKKMKKFNGKNRLSLTLMFSAVIFLILFIAISLTVGIMYLLVWLEAIPAYEGTAIEITPLLLFVSFISLIIGFGISVLLVRFPLQPFNKVISLTNRLAAGDFSARMNFGKTASSIHALKELTDSFNKMAHELENTEMLRADFINNFSHEFKTPIVSIAGFAKLLKNGNLSEEQKKEYISIIEEESLRLSEMATKVLNLTKIENQTILSDINKFNLSEQIRHCVLLLENKWSDKSIEFDMEFNEIYISANEEMLKQVWINLLDNAIKFSPNGSIVSISIIQTPNNITVCVKNSGSEIPKEEHDIIFRKFYQTDRSHASHGNGIGLAIVKKIVSLHQGTIRVESQNLTTSFFISLPNNF